METPGMIKTRLLLRKAEIEARFGQSPTKFHAQDSTGDSNVREPIGHTATGDLMHSPEQEILSELVKINRALQRLEEGEYTKCSSCSLPISERRLKAFPATDLCYNCATKSYFTI